VNKIAKTLIGLSALALMGIAFAYPEYQRRSTAFYACAQHSTVKLAEPRSSGDKFYAENNFFFADKGARNAAPDETRGYQAIVVYDIGYTPDRLVMRCYVDNGVVSNFEVLGKVTP
jgi:hypothetical protein